MPETKKDRVVWYAAGGYIAKCGPFDSQVEAWNAMLLTSAARRKHGNRMHPANTYAWPEKVE